ncbi:BnaA04g27640D [Brassica napus]|uniref:BnaA04g27640D protein n=1 Tax=Brassica napus TaxID=3708 RepID=A0A078JH93_BRANA|nr:BnaA04g27640D [Brassica napus]
MEVAKLRNIQASEAAQIGIGVNAQLDTDLPRSLAEIFWEFLHLPAQVKGLQFYFKAPNLHCFLRFSFARACTCASLCCQCAPLKQRSLKL